MIELNELISLFDYKDGKLLYKTSSGRCKKGSAAGSLNYTGYVNIKINGKMHRAHRLIFMYHFSYFPDQIDHINGIKSDNRIENLRPCDNSKNKMNTSLYKNNTSGVKGVSWCKNHSKWVVNICKDKKQITLGYFSELPEAKKVVEAARECLHGEFCNHG
jgi:hypothetical protein